MSYDNQSMVSVDEDIASFVESDDEADDDSRAMKGRRNPLQSFGALDVFQTTNSPKTDNNADGSENNRRQLFCTATEKKAQLERKKTQRTMVRTFFFFFSSKSEFCCN